MKTHFILNGNIKLSLSPESEIELQLLNELFKQPVDAIQVATLQVADKNLPNSVIITPGELKKEN